MTEAADHPERRLSELSLLAPAERHQLLVEWNDTAVAAVAPARLDARFAAQVRRTPDAVALVAGGARLTYGELARRAAALAGRLRAAGVGPEVRVGVCLPRGPELVVALLAVLEAGGAYVPLDAAYPEERLAYMLEDSGAPVVVASAATRERLGLPRLARPPAVIGPDGTGPASEAGPAEGRPTSPAPVGGDLLAYLIYTSGSTGRPKGVAIPHRAASALLAWAERRYAPEELEGVLAGTSICFDLSVYELFLPLATGGRVVLAADVLGAADHLATGEVTLVNTVPSAMRELVAAGGLPASVRTVNLAGELLPRSLADAIYRSRPGVERVYNLYGPSEDTTYSTVARVERPGAEARGEPPIGVPLEGTRGHVLDRRLVAVPLGVPGELGLAGRGLARGYLGRPARTAAGFVPDPFAPRPGERLYRTGDLVRRRPTGVLEFLSRLDHQVKLRGFRVELGEIEAVLAGDPRVEEAVVVARRRAGELMLVAYVAPAGPGERPADESLRALVARCLPAYMVPAAFVTLDALPRTPNGKVDRKALPAPVWREASGGRRPTTAAEELVAALFVEVLGFPAGRPVAVDADFFRLGGHSLLATRLVSRLRAASGVELPLAAVFETPTVAGLARRLEAAAGGDATPGPIPRRPDPATAPASFAQERLWFLAELDPGSATYNMPGAVRLEGRLAVPAMAAALGDLVARHEALRTELVETGDGPVQRVLPASGPARSPRPALPLVDLSGLAEARREGAARDLVAREAARAVGLGRAPLLRTTLLRVGPTEHVFVLVMHHAVADGWSLGIFVRELAAFYGARAARRRAELPALPVQYGDFALWQRRRLAGAAAAGLLEWWRRELAGAPTVLDLPADRPRPAASAGAGGVVRIPLPAPLVQRLEAYGRERGATLFMLLLAGFQALVARTSGRDDLVVGTPNAGRDRGELEGLIGLFVDTLALRLRADGDPSLDALVAGARETCLRAFAHRELPFDRLVDELAPERRPGVPPLIQVVLALQNAPLGPLELPGLRLERMPAETGGAKFDLGVSFEPAEAGLVGVWSFSAALFDAATVRRMAGHLEGVYRTLVEAPGRRLGELALLSAAERQQVLVEWNDEVWPVASEGFVVHRLVARWAEATPDAVALVSGREQVSFRALWRRARELADALRGRGAGPERLVGVCAERSVGLVVAVLGILEAGAAYVPLDPGYPAERLELMIAEAGLEWVVTGRRAGERLAGLGAELVELDDPAPPRGTHPPSAAAPREALPDNPVYAIFTSGSTGRPKGVVVAHRSVANRLLFAAATDPVGRGTGLLKASICFDLSVLELVSPLVAGTRLVLARPGGQGDMEYLLDLVARERISQAAFLPSQLSVLMEQPELARTSCLDALMTGGEAVPPGLPGRFAERIGRPLYNRYGPTETTLSVTSWRCGGDPDAGAVPIGRGIAGAEIRLLGPGLRPVAVGVPGELAIGGVCVTRGYLGRSALTAERFVPDPFAGRPGGRLYRSGDLARWRPDGAVEFLGRIDQQVKIRGFRIELGEIEAALAQHPGVLEAAVVDCDAPGTENRRLAAYVVADSSAAPEPADLRDFLAAKLPAYMVPSAFAVLDELPLAGSGKVDRKRLPEPSWDSAPRRQHLAPRTPVEERLAALFAEVLEVERVGVADDFFELGGHSLLATRLVARVRAAFDVELPLRRLFETPTVAGLAEALEAREETPSEAPPLVRLERPPGGPGGDGAWPASFAQERLWFLTRLDPGSPAYHMPGAVRIEGALAPRAFAAAFGDVVRRHETLRTGFDETATGVFQQVHPAAPVALPVIDLGGLPAPLRPPLSIGLAKRVAEVPFDLGKGPLLRVALLRLASREHLVALSMHHVASDGWSVGVLVREVAACYRARLAGERPALPELPVRYRDFAVWQRGWLRDEALERRLVWWREVLIPAPPALALPFDRPRPAVPTLRAGELRASFGEAADAGLQALARRLRATPFMVLLAAFAALLGRYGGQDDLAVGSPVAGRDRRELEGLIGFFVNTLALRLDLSGDPSFSELVARTRETTLGSFAHQDLPFERLVEALAPARDLSTTPLVQVMFALQNAPRERLAIPGAHLERVPLPVAAAKFDLAVDFEERDGCLEARLEYRRDLFDGTSIRRLAAHLATLLSGALAAPGTPLSRLPLLGAGERRQLLGEWNDTAAGDPGRAAIEELFAAQAERRPEALAVTTRDGALSYGELGRRSRALARRLRAAGVGPETRVGLCVERSLALPVALLAILEAGGAYVPLDPDYPAERLAFMVEDAGLSVLVGQAELLAGLPGHGLPAVRIGATGLAGAPAADEVAPPAAAPAPGGAERLAYVMYTSGSTGRPNGVAIAHRGVVRLVREIGYTELGPGKIVLQVAPISFDASTAEIWAALLNGGRLAMLPPGVPSLAELGRTLAEQRVTTLWLTAGLFHQVVEGDLSVLAGVGHVLAGGDVVARGAVERALRELPGCRVSNCYGPTENTTFTSTHPVPATGWDGGGRGSEVARPLPIGRPIANTGIYLLDRDLEAVPIGVAGELWTGGVGLARGYWGRPRLTAGRFAPHPWGERPGGRVYRTGDLVRRLPGGEIEFLGRLDHQVKIRGFRIEPGEIEAALAADPRVAAAVVVARKDASGDGRLDAYVVPADPGRAAPDEAAGLGRELRSALADRLPDYLVPATVTVLAELPADPQQQARPPGAAGARSAAAGARGRLRAARDRARAGPGGVLERGFGDRAGRDPRRLLHPGRPLVEGDPGAPADARRLRGRGAGPPVLRGADDRRPLGGGRRGLARRDRRGRPGGAPRGRGGVTAARRGIRRPGRGVLRPAREGGDERPGRRAEELAPGAGVMAQSPLLRSPRCGGARMGAKKCA